MICVLLLGSQRAATLAAVASPSVNATFIAWSDQHVTASGDASHLKPAVDAINAMADVNWPEELGGGKIGQIDFVLGCGDCTDWPTRAARDAYERAATKAIKWSSYDLLGNHDEGALALDEKVSDGRRIFAVAAAGLLIAAAVAWRLARIKRGRIIFSAIVLGSVFVAAGVYFRVSSTAVMKEWIIARHGRLSYTFDKGGVRFIALYSPFNERQIITPEALAYLNREVTAVPKGTPIVVATHLWHDAIRNQDAFVSALGEANVVLVLGGHYHHSAITEDHGIQFVQVPSPKATNDIMVIRIAGQRVSIGAYDYGKRAWSDNVRATFTTPEKR